MQNLLVLVLTKTAKAELVRVACILMEVISLGMKAPKALNKRSRRHLQSEVFMINHDEKWALEWSHKQNCFHIQRLEESFAITQDCFIINRPPLYSILMIGDKEVCHRMANSWRSRIRERDIVRASETPIFQGL